jgi:protease-4
MTADAIVAHPTTVTGSIGVVLWNVNLSGLMGKLGIADETFTSGRYKDTGSPLREMQEEDREIIQGVVDDLHDRFKEVVAEGRPQLVGSEFDTVCDGRIFSAPQALEAGLIDEIGHFEAAVRLLENKLGIAESRIVSYQRPDEYRSNIHTSATTPNIEISLLNVGDERLEPGFYYLWLPQGP